MFACLFVWYVWWRVNCYTQFVGSWYPSIIISSLLLNMIFFCQRWLCIHCNKIVQLRLDCSGGWEIFLNVLLGLINSEFGSGIGAWMPLWMSWGVSPWLGFLMDPLCVILFSGHPDSFLCILSQILGHLCMVVVGIKWGVFELKYDYGYT